jgi:dienelactone hydrolase
MKFKRTSSSRLWIRASLSTILMVVLGNVVAEEQNRSSVDSEVTIAALRAKDFSAELTFEKHLYTKQEITGDLYSYLSDGLKVYALVNTPTKIAPDVGFPVLIYGHGFHPEPKKYAISSDGIVSRPGDYYRGIPERYARGGYLVITPDYRGYNISAGFEYTERDSLSSSYYAVDVLHLISAIDKLPHANSNRLLYAGHSMGGDVGLKAMLANNKITAASLWSPVIGSTAQRALYYGRYYDKDKNVGVDQNKLTEYRKKIEGVYANLSIAISAKDVDAINHLQYLMTPLIVHHARGDRSAPYQWVENLVVEMNELGKEFLFFSYDTNNHLFEGENLERAFERDLEFFSNY